MNRLAVAAASVLAACAHPRTEASAEASAGEPARAAVEFTPVAETEALHGANPHDHEGKPLCQRCHAQGETRLAVDPVALCARCHEPGNMKHPFGVVAASAPSSLPLSRDGRIVCHTCHDPHSVKAHPHGLRLAFRQLCAQCHAGHGRGPARASGQ
jgi:predicted CXXCH cytochrome family protein